MYSTESFKETTSTMFSVKFMLVCGLLPVLTFNVCSRRKLRKKVYEMIQSESNTEIYSVFMKFGPVNILLFCISANTVKCDTSM